jgi:phosphatidylglycerophosphate synthase
MKAVIAIPELAGLISEQPTTEMLLRPVAGVPLLMRTALTAVRAGASQVLLICPLALSDRLLQQFTAELTQRGVQVTALRVGTFNPRAWSGWVILKPYLEKQFVWLPWNWVTTKRSITQLPPVKLDFVDWSKPAFITLQKADREVPSKIFSPRSAGGIAVTSSKSALAAERFLVANSGKVSDGIHTSFNRRLCRPFVRLLSHTAITPNAVTFGGVAVSILSAIAFAQGTYRWSVLGAFLFYIAGLFDEMDGMLARIKFAESPSGTWLEGAADGLSYLLLFGGITIGLSRHYGAVAIWTGVALLIGSILALITTSLQRRRATTPDKPNEYLGRIYQLLEKDSGNWISRVVRQVQGFQRRGILVHYIVIFTILGLLPLVFLLATIGAHLTWILTLYFNRRFFSQSSRSEVKSIGSRLKEAL